MGAPGDPLLRRRENTTDMGQRGRARRKKREALTRPMGFQSWGEWGANLIAIAAALAMTVGDDDLRLQIIVIKMAGERASLVLIPSVECNFARRLISSQLG